ncbi:MAG TPA: LLM class flavin-dependent oxidoreductase [Polyangiaceae bacterium]|nr:LLM class flavin-dependent oxidoreductase [Polyangiaceae bacterium]
MSIDVYWRLPLHGCKGELAVLGYDRGDWNPPRAGNLAPGWGPRGADDVVFADHVADIARAAEVSGFVGGLLVSFPGTDDPWTLAPALARETKTFRFMIAFQPGFINPVHAARLSASLQRLSGGRLVYNIITGGGGPAQLWWGDRVAHDDRYARTTEFLDVLKGVWKHGPFDFEGRFYQVERGELAPALSAQPVPEIYFSGSSDAAVASAGRHADYYLSHLEPFDSLRVKLDRVKERAAKEGRSAKVALRFDILARPSVEEAWRDVERAFAALPPGALDRAGGERGDAVGFARQRSFVPSRIGGVHDLDVDQHIAPALWGGFNLFRGGPGIGVVGNYEQAAEWLDRYLRAGVDSFVLAGTPHLEEAYRVGEEVLPLVRGRTSARLAREPGATREPPREAREPSLITS